MSKVGTSEEPPVDSRLESGSHLRLVSFPSCNNVSLVITCMVMDDLF
jgi:hypothetical protein